MDRVRSLPGAPLVEVSGVSKRFSVRKGPFGKRAEVLALDNVSLTIGAGETVGLLGASGSGKTTLGRMLMKLGEPDKGEILFDKQPLGSMKGPDLKRFRRRAQMVFQNPFDAFNPRFTMRRSLTEPLLVAGIDRADYEPHLNAVMRLTGLLGSEAILERHPHELSGGQLQRCVVARAMILRPDFIIGDEPVSMLDVSVRAGILILLRALHADHALTGLYISHDISFVRYLCERTVVMYQGRIVEDGPTEQIIRDPQHDYTRQLIAASPRRPTRAVGGRSVQKSFS